MLGFGLLLFVFTCSIISVGWYRGNRPTASVPSLVDLQYRTSVDISFESLLKRHAVNNTIFLMLTDYGYMDNFLNAYYAGNLREYGNLVVACMDPLAYKHLQGMHIPSFLLDTSKAGLGNSIYSSSTRLTQSFIKKTRLKLVAISLVLNAGYRTLYMDSDIILVKNPMTYLNALKPTHFISQRDFWICSGFMLIYPTALSKKIFNVAATEVNGDDQEIIARLLKKERIEPLLLPTNLFVSGETFFKNHQFYWDLKKSEPFYEIHNNFIRGGIGKTLRMKEMKHYYLDKKGEYSNPTQKYLTFELLKSGKYDYLKKTDSTVLNQLKKMVKVANALNRSLIIPPIPCKKSGVAYCNICYFHYRYCFEDVLRTTVQPFKESIFIENSLVPEHVKERYRLAPVYDYSKKCYKSKPVISTFPSNKGNRNKRVCKACGSHSYEKCIIRDHLNNKDQVLKIDKIIG